MLVDDIAHALPELRAQAESLMTSTCTIREKASGEPVTGPDGEVTFPPGPVVYSGKCRVRPAGGQSGTVDVGGAELFTFDYLVSLPFDADGSANVREGMPCRIDTSPDPALVGVEVEVSKVDRGDHITARRLFCSEVS